jgi:hypothetical protein
MSAFGGKADIHFILMQRPPIRRRSHHVGLVAELLSDGNASLAAQHPSPRPYAFIELSDRPRLPLPTPAEQT